MSPRGVTIPEVRQQLFDAAERVLLREGPSGLTGRAITREAGVATGLLHNHFGDLDGFLAALLIDRARAAARRLDDLPTRAGAATVADNLMAGVEALSAGNLLALAGLALARPSLVPRLGEAFGEGAVELDASERTFTAYLEAEQRLGRVPPGADAASLALALVGATHQFLLTRGPQAPELRERMRRVIRALIGP
ncbi:TetR/AcrR family transcriptional regulator [Nonomuraea rhodomycinica]|uniref:TetR family transcriptional regulator n=1 Tax=Nonomuraea rhodomycinica TaxID=1712872 RepID=A0A7Y6IJI1_9ACTN|nr:TetR/AcrR family transcriptional regulator [Nonomuraea rhodomycinica]NUW39434.1 TetR family transcriptional regulator [Nonomuraea rhodomycinica]